MKEILIGDHRQFQYPKTILVEQEMADQVFALLWKIDNYPRFDPDTGERMSLKDASLLDLARLLLLKSLPIIDSQSFPEYDRVGTRSNN